MGVGEIPKTASNSMGDEEECHDIGAIQAHLDGPTEFALQARYRLAARESVIKWDCGERVQKGYLRNATAVPGPYKTGVVVSYSRRARKEEKMESSGVLDVES
jgi:hypothetical protein